jgi:hypothetical protein
MVAGPRSARSSCRRATGKRSGPQPFMLLRSKRRIWAAFIASWIVDAAFNESVDYFGLSPTLAIGQTIS